MADRRCAVCRGEADRCGWTLCRYVQGMELFFSGPVLTGDAIRNPGKYVKLLFRAGDKQSRDKSGPEATELDEVMEEGCSD